MTSRVDSTERLPVVTGRHRHGAGTWTPDVPPRAPGGRHSSFAPPPLDPPARGSLPVISGMLFDDSPPWAAIPAARGEFPACHGTLPVPPEPPPCGKPRRTKVTLTPAAAENEDAGEYGSPAETGLSSFDIGSVPASVTPPRSWRRAAWFATASSGGVVVALLFAGSALVGKPAPNQADDAWIPGLGGGLPSIQGERVVPGPAGGTSDSIRDPRSRPARTTTPADGTSTYRSPSPGAPANDAAGRTTFPSDDSSSFTPPTTTPVPQKPAFTPAPYTQDPLRLQIAQADPKQLAQDSQDYLDLVTENPDAAYTMTTGELQQEGTAGIERKYADVAYFQVQRVQVHQYDGTTVCTVKTVRKNGAVSTEQRTLTFDEGKIASDGS